MGLDLTDVSRKGSARLCVGHFDLCLAIFGFDHSSGSELCESSTFDFPTGTFYRSLKKNLPFQLGDVALGLS